MVQFILPLVILTLAAGCATKPIPQKTPFSFSQDTFSYANELTWEYNFDETGKWSAKKREPKPDYTLHCFVVARSAKQFFHHARFDSSLPKADDETNRKLVQQIIATSPRKILAESEKIVIPGYANLREFSMENERLLKEECGGAWQSYLQRGNWRMVFPFSRRNQAREANRLLAKVKKHTAPVVHIVRFPNLDVNHAILLFDGKRNENTILFSVYDPNNPSEPTTLTFEEATRTFQFPQNDYFIGGKVNVYEVYHSPWK